LRSPRTTDGTIALSNLEAHIDGLELSRGRGELDSPAWSELIDLITLRAQIRGRIADYERASALAEQCGLGLLARARTRAALHRFDEALADLDSAERFGSPDPEVEAERAAILQAVGRYDEALALRRTAAERRADFESLAGLASPPC
jgi:tetratricopeptide (TPR) repeat protein